jgi:hypothetical protein
MKSRRPATTAADVRDAYNTQMSFRLQAREQRALHLLAERDGVLAAGLIRRWIREAYRTTFGKEV